MNRDQQSERLDRIVVALLVAAIAVPRMLLSSCTTDFGADGSYYTDVAQNVRDGNGLTTDLSIFHQAFPEFPHPTPVYPMWPLVYGAIAKVVPVEIVGIWLPTLFYFVAVGLSYVVGRRLVRQRLFADLPFHGGHVLAVLVALNYEFASATARPYTEGLAFVLLFGLLVRAPALWRSLGFLAGAELGLWLIAMFLTRSQFVVVGIAAFGAGLLAVVRRPRDGVAFVVTAGVVATVVWQLYARWLGTFLPEPSLHTYLRFDLARVSDLLSEVPVMAETGGPVWRLVDMVDGLRWAFSLYNTTSSYQALHHATAYALPLAAIVLATRWRKIPVVWRFLQTAPATYAVFFHLAALGLVGSLHTVHKVYGSPWVFGGRHAIPSVLLVVTALLYLMRSRQRYIRAAGMFLFLAGIYGAWRELAMRTNDQCREAIGAPPLQQFRPQLRRWLMSQRDELGELTLAVERPEAQLLAWRTPGVGFHWITETTTVADLEVMVNQLDVDYVVMFDYVHHVKVNLEPGFDDRFAMAVVFREPGSRDEDEPDLRGKPTRVYAPRCSFFPEAPSCLSEPTIDLPDDPDGP